MATTHPECGLFLTSLDPQQTKSGSRSQPRQRRTRLSPGGKDFERRAEREAYRLPPPTSTEIVFRHGGWLADRGRVRRALVACGAREGRLERFDSCGTDCVIEYSAKLQKHRVRASYCGDRFCVPCSVARSAKIRPKLKKLCEGKRVRFVTLTRTGDDASLVDALNDVYRSFGKLRECRLWRSSVTGGAAVVEITRGKNLRHWHVHLHILCVGSYLPQRELSEAWRHASGGSFIVHVREVKDHAAGIDYTCKYVTKGFDRSVVLDPDALLECVVALRGRRLLAAFGEWYGSNVELERDNPGDWRNIGRLDVVATASLRCEPWAVAVCKSLNIWFAADAAGVHALTPGTG